MRRSLIISGMVAGVVGGAVYYFVKRNDGAWRTGVQQRARDSAAWLQGQQQELTQGMHRIEDQITQLGDEMRQRLDQLARQAADAVQPRLDEDWSLEKDDLQDELRGLPGR